MLATDTNGHTFDPPPMQQPEWALLGAILLDNTKLDAAASLLTPDDFEDPINGEIFRVALEVVRGGGRADPITLAPRFGKAEQHHLRHLPLHAGVSANVPNYASIVHEQRRRREFAIQLESARDSALDPHTNLDTLARQLAMDVEAFASAGPSRLSPVTLPDFFAADLKQREWIVEGLLAERSTAMCYAWRGGGKTWLALALGVAIAAGGPFLRWSVPRPRSVLHVCGEMPAIALRERVQLIAAGKPPCDLYRLLSADLHEHGLPDLASPDGQAAVDRALGDAEVVILDNVSTLMRSGVENEAESWLPVQQWLLRLRRQGRSVILIHHANKGRAQRGTSRREDILDVVLNLRAPEDYDPTEGARFEVHYEKARGLHGAAVEPFEAKLEVINGRTIWTTQDLGDAKGEEIAELRGQGLTLRQIGKTLGMSKSAVDRSLKKQGCPAVPHPSNGTEGQQRGKRDGDRDKEGTGGKKGKRNLRVVSDDDGT